MCVSVCVCVCMCVCEIDRERARERERERERERKKEREREKKQMFYLTMHSTHYICGYISLGKRIPLLPLHGFFFFLLAARVLLYAPSHTEDSTYQL